MRWYARSRNVRSVIRSWAAALLLDWFVDWECARKLVGQSQYGLNQEIWFLKWSYVQIGHKSVWHNLAHNGIGSESKTNFIFVHCVYLSIYIVYIQSGSASLVKHQRVFEI